jgi:hypothetical protein
VAGMIVQQNSFVVCIAGIEVGGETGSRTRDVDLARINCSPLPSPCLVVVSIHTLRVFSAALSPD